LANPGLKAKARELFVENFEKIAGGREEVSWRKFYMAVGRKVDLDETLQDGLNEHEQT
jgi:hypothetical protein